MTSGVAFAHAMGGPTEPPVPGGEECKQLAYVRSAANAAQLRPVPGVGKLTVCLGVDAGGQGSTQSTDYRNERSLFRETKLT